LDFLKEVLFFAEVDVIAGNNIALII